MRPPDLPDAVRLGPWPRLGLATGATLILAVLVLARWLEPDPRGFGTHTQLGLAPCGFRAATGRPCPGCGLTTAFAWSVRGQWGAAWWANPAGLGLTLGSAAAMVWMAGAAVRGRPGPFRTWEGPLVGGSVAALALTVVVWTLRIALRGFLG